jgi:hypothetical protein
MDVGGSLSIVADANTLVPGTDQTFSWFDHRPALDRGSVAFSGFSPAGGEGIYVDTGGVLRAVADTSTGIPGTRRTFSTFGEVSLDRGNLAFSADGGIYAELDGTLMKILEPGDMLDGGIVVGVGSPVFPAAGSLSREALSGNEIAFQVTLEEPTSGSRSQAIFVAAVPEPRGIPLGISAIAAVGLLAALRR